MPARGVAGDGGGTIETLEQLEPPTAVRRSDDSGGELVSTGMAKQLGACRGADPRKSTAIANLTANDETYALAA